MNQDVLPIKGRKHMKRLLAELASRQSNWRQEKTQEIINSQKTGLSSTSLLRSDTVRVHRELPSVKSANHSAKYIQGKPQSKPRIHLVNTSNLPHNGNVQDTKRSITQKSQSKQTWATGGKTIRDENQQPRYEKQPLFPKINLIKKRSYELVRDETKIKQKIAAADALQTIQEEQPSTIKKEMGKNTYKILQKEFY